jgi:quercetin dioxygenase-like cupin family protein
MKVKVQFVVSLLFASLVFVTLPARAQDPVKAAPQVFTERINNDHVRVLEYRSKPGTKETMHSHPALVIYVISGGKLKSTTPDGKSQVLKYKTGDVVWREAVTHTVENIGTTELHSIFVEMKKPKTRLPP